MTLILFLTGIGGGGVMGACGGYLVGMARGHTDGFNAGITKASDSRVGGHDHPAIIPCRAGCPASSWGGAASQHSHHH